MDDAERLYARVGDQKSARWFGVLYRVTFVTSITALLLYEPALREGLERFAMLRGLDLWLRADMNEAKPMRGLGLLVAPSSARLTANGDSLDGPTVMALCELIDPPARREPAVHASPHLGARELA